MIPVEVRHGTAIRLLGVVLLILLAALTSIFVYLDRAFIQDLYNLYLVAFGILATIAVQMAIWPQRFVPRPAQLANPLSTEQKPIPTQNLRLLTEGEIFESDLSPHQNIFHRGDPVMFWARFKGTLVDGFLQLTLRTLMGHLP